MSTDFLVLGDYPAPNDKERSFRDAHGRYLLHLLYVNNVNIRQVGFDFLYSKPQDVYSGNHHMASIMSKHKPKVILALGQQTMKVLGIEGSLAKMRGSVFEQRLGGHKYYVVPTFNPRDMKDPARMFADEPIEKGFYTSGDVHKAWGIVKHGWKVPEEKFNLSPTIEDVREFCREATESKAILGMDIESTGLNTDFVPIVVLGIATDEEHCMMIPFLKEAGKNYWSMKEELEVRQLLKELMTTNRLLFQNGVGYDVPLLIKRGWKFPIENFTDDTMVLHHVISPELPHNIGFISSQYGKQPYWKESFLSRKEHIFETDQEEMKTYCARDCVALHQIRNGMMRHLDDLEEQDQEVYGELRNVYAKNMEASWASIEMSLHGVAISKHKLKLWQDYIGERLAEIEGTLAKIYPLPTAFNWSSPHHKRYLLYGEVPKALKDGKWKQELASYDTEYKNYQYYCTECSRKVTQKFAVTDEIPQSLAKMCPGCKDVRRVLRTPKEATSVKPKSKETKKYVALKELEDLSKLEVLPKLRRYVPLTTDKGQSALDGAAITRYIGHIHSRFDDMDEMKTRPKRCIQERKDLELTLSVLTQMKDLSKYKKLVESFWDFPLGSDGRVHPQFLVTGTATGRWSCKKPNLQQIPSGKTGKMIRSAFKASKGCTLIGIDYSNLEVQVGARVFGDTPLIKMLEAGLNMHDENTKIFFGITKEDPKWDKLRKVSKIIMFGRLLYGGTDRGIYTQVMTAVPDCGLSFRKFCEAVQNYMDAHPEFQEWCDQVQQIAEMRSISINAFGRVRTLLGGANAISRQALNSPIQGSAADVARDAIIAIRRGLKAKGLKSQIILAVHDEIIMEVINEELKDVYELMRDSMNAKITVRDYVFRIPIDAELGSFWGDMGAFDTETFKKVGGSKH